MFTHVYERKCVFVDDKFDMTNLYGISLLESGKKKLVTTCLQNYHSDVWIVSLSCKIQTTRYS